MAENAPPLPFGSSASIAKSVADPSSKAIKSGLSEGRLFFTGRQGIQDVTSLIGEKLFERLEIHGSIGTTSVVSESTGLVTDVDPNRVRQPFVLTCQKWIGDGRYIVCRVNPKDVGWRMPQRSAVQKTRVGEILHVWRDRFRGTFYDEPQISINFQAGNIMPIRRQPVVAAGVEKLDSTFDQFGNEIAVIREKKAFEPTEEVTVPQGLDNFYEFLQLVDEQKILDDGSINYVYIMYNSRIFPNLTLAGLFTPEGVSWSDSSDDPNTVQSWSSNFTIYDSYPRLHDLNTLRKFFREAGWGRI